MAERSEGTIEIEATPKEIMDVVTDFEAYPEWADVESAKVLKEDKQGRGKQVQLDVNALGLSDTLVLEYTYLARNKGCSWRLVSGKNVKDLEGSYEFEPGDGATTVIYRLGVEPAIPLPGLVKRQIEKRMLKSALDGLKRRVERG